MHVAAKIWNPSSPKPSGLWSFSMWQLAGNMAKPGVETTDTPWSKHGGTPTVIQGKTSTPCDEKSLVSLAIE